MSKATDGPAKHQLLKLIQDRLPNSLWRRMTAKETIELGVWAAALADAVTQHELRSLIRQHEAIGRDPNVDAEDQKLARRQAQALRKQLD